jgi:hypothetical protein
MIVTCPLRMSLLKYAIINLYIVYLCIISFLRPSLEVVKEGWILNKIIHLQIINVSVFYFTQGLRQVLKEKGSFDR